jgi:hypothetical protein
MTVDAFQLERLNPALGEMYVVTPNVMLSEDQRRALAKQWEEAWEGSPNRPKLLVLPCGWSLDVIRQRQEMTAADLGLIEEPGGLVFEEISREQFEAMKRRYPTFCQIGDGTCLSPDDCIAVRYCRLAF